MKRSHMLCYERSERHGGLLSRSLRLGLPSPAAGTYLLGGFERIIIGPKQTLNIYLRFRYTTHQIDRTGLMEDEL